jgi:Phosphotransferase enzyme family
MRPLSAILAGLAGALFMVAPATDQVADVVEEKTGRRHRMHNWHTLPGIPEDAGLPALGAMRQRGVSEALPYLELGTGAVEVALRGYTEGKRATMEVRSADRRFAVKAFSQPPELEAQLYAALAGGSGVIHIPRLAGWDPELRVLAIEWLDAPTLSAAIKSGQGRRAGELAAAWILGARNLHVTFGPHLGAESMLAKAYKWADGLGAADHALGVAASAVARHLVASQPVEGATQLLHGSLYDRHLLDMGDGPGLIDWDCFGQGPAEVDAAVFLSVVRRGALHRARAEASEDATDAFLACTAGVLDEHVLAWHQAVNLLRLAHKKTRRTEDNALATAQPLLDEAARLAASV